MLKNVTSWSIRYFIYSCIIEHCDYHSIHNLIMKVFLIWYKYTSNVCLLEAASKWTWLYEVFNFCQEKRLVGTKRREVGNRVCAL